MPSCHQAGPFLVLWFLLFRRSCFGTWDHQNSVWPGILLIHVITSQSQSGIFGGIRWHLFIWKYNTIQCYTYLDVWCLLPVCLQIIKRKVGWARKAFSPLFLLELIKHWSRPWHVLFILPLSLGNNSSLTSLTTPKSSSSCCMGMPHLHKNSWLFV